MKIPIANNRKVKLDMTMKFGQYEGNTLREIRASNPQYFRWLLKTYHWEINDENNKEQ